LREKRSWIPPGKDGNTLMPEKAKPPNSWRKKKKRKKKRMMMIMMMKTMINLLVLCTKILYRVITLPFSANCLAWRVEISVIFQALQAEFKVMKFYTHPPFLAPKNTHTHTKLNYTFVNVNHELISIISTEMFTVARTHNFATSHQNCCFTVCS
jgi:hypothetical protein